MVDYIQYNVPIFYIKDKELDLINTTKILKLIKQKELTDTEVLNAYNKYSIDLKNTIFSKDFEKAKYKFWEELLKYLEWKQQ